MADSCFSVILLLSLFIRITDNNRYYLTQSEPVNKKNLIWSYLRQGFHFWLRMRWSTMFNDYAKKGKKRAINMKYLYLKDRIENFEFTQILDHSCFQP